MPKMFNQFREQIREDADDIGGFFHSRKGMWTGIGLAGGVFIGFVWVAVAQLIGFLG